MSGPELKPGTRLELRRLPDAGEVADYVSQLLEPVVPGQAILIAMPIHGCQYVLWPSGTRLRVSLIEPGRGIWRFVARIGSIGTVGEDINRIRTYALYAESEPERCQRRAHFRVDCLLNASLGPMSVRAVTQNISGGGACILSDEPPDDAGHIELALPEDGELRRIAARFQIVRCEAAWVAGLPKHRVSIRFTEISRSDQDALVRCLLRLQLRQKRQESRDADG